MLIMRIFIKIPAKEALFIENWYFSGNTSLLNLSFKRWTVFPHKKRTMIWFMVHFRLAGFISQTKYVYDVW